VANVRRGIKRIIWVLSVGSTIAAWIILFSITDLIPQKKVNQAGVAFIKWLDNHYFEDKGGLTVDEFQFITRFPKNYGNKIEGIVSRIENEVKPDSVEKWPFMWELKSPIADRFDSFDINSALRSLWKERLKEALRSSENDIIKVFPDINITAFMQRYGVIERGEKFGINRYIEPAPDSYFKVVYLRPYGRIILVILSGFVPFALIWLLYLLVIWVIQGFR